MIEWGTVQTKDCKAAMIIGGGEGGVKFKKFLRKVWVQNDWPTRGAMGFSHDMSDWHYPWSYQECGHEVHSHH
jgi:hypothetical protein